MDTLSLTWAVEDDIYPSLPYPHFYVEEDRDADKVEEIEIFVSLAWQSNDFLSVIAAFSY